jgi:hypothetical protein
MSGDEFSVQRRISTVSSRDHTIQRRPSEVGDDPRRRCKILAGDVFASPISLTRHIHTAILRGSRRLTSVGAHAAVSGGVAQLGERVNGIHEVRGSIPLASIAAELSQDRGRSSNSLIRRRCGEAAGPSSSARFCGNSSVGRAQPCQGWGRGFESRFPLSRWWRESVGCVSPFLRFARVVKVKLRAVSSVG